MLYRDILQTSNPIIPNFRLNFNNLPAKDEKKPDTHVTKPLFVAELLYKKKLRIDLAQRELLDPVTHRPLAYLPEIDTLELINESISDNILFFAVVSGI